MTSSSTVLVHFTIQLKSRNVRPQTLRRYSDLEEDNQPFLCVSWAAHCVICSVVTNSKAPGCVLAETVKGHGCGLRFVLSGFMCRCCHGKTTQPNWCLSLSCSYRSCGKLSVFRNSRASKEAEKSLFVCIVWRKDVENHLPARKYELRRLNAGGENSSRTQRGEHEQSRSVAALRLCGQNGSIVALRNFSYDNVTCLCLRLAVRRVAYSPTDTTSCQTKDLCPRTEAPRQLTHEAGLSSELR